MAQPVARVFTVYGTVKAGLEHATRLLANDLPPRIRGNAVAPGAILTDALRKFIERDDGSTPDHLSRVPMRRLGTPEDIAAAVLHLCGPAAAYMTGVVIPVDGGIRVPVFESTLEDL